VCTAGCEPRCFLRTAAAAVKQRLSSHSNLPLRHPASHVSIGSETSSMSTAEGSEAPSLGTPLASSPLPFTSSLGGASSFGSSFCNTQSPVSQPPTLCTDAVPPCARAVTGKSMFCCISGHSRGPFWHLPYRQAPGSAVELCAGIAARQAVRPRAAAATPNGANMRKHTQR